MYSLTRFLKVPIEQYILDNNLFQSKPQPISEPVDLSPEFGDATIIQIILTIVHTFRRRHEKYQESSKICMRS